MAFRLPEETRKGSHRHNLELLIAKGQRLADRFGIDFDDDEWPFSRERGGRHRKEKLKFSMPTTGKKASERLPFPEPFSSMAKSLLLQIKEERGSSTGYLGQILTGFRLLNEVSQGRHPTLLTSIQWDEALTLATSKYAPSTHSSHGYVLQLIAERLDEHQITVIPLYWKTSLPPPPGYFEIPLLPDHQEVINSKLPDPGIFEALPEIYTQLTSDQDILLASIVLLLLCGGFRCMEVLTLPANCWHEEIQTKAGGNQILIDNDGNPLKRFGIRYVPAKGGQTINQIKYLPTVMAPLAKKAVEEIRRITEPFRENAKFMHDHPGRARLDAEEGITAFNLSDAVRTLGIHPDSGRHFFQSRNLPYFSNELRKPISRQALENVVLSCSILLPIMVHPWVQELHDSLLVVGKSYFSQRGNPIKGSAVPVSYSNLRDWLCGHVDPRPGRTPVRSVFERFNKIDSMGRPLKVNTHQFRHWINTLMHRGGLSDVEIARWSGRKSLAQNSVYNHMSPIERAQLVRQLSAEGKVHGTVQSVQNRMSPVRREEFREAIFQNIHTTDLGYCIHDYASIPREAPPECATCSGLLVPKGSPKALAKAEQFLNEEEWLVQQAKKELAEGTYGVSPWLEHHLYKLDQLRRIVALHHDPKTQDGDLFQITPPRGPGC